MKLTYIYHSGFVIEGMDFTLIMDYFKDSNDAYIHRLLPSFAGRVYVLSSHWHPDHFNAEILQWKQQRPDIQYVFSKDILKKKLAKASDAVFLVKGETWQDDRVRIQAFGSTDVGVSFLIEAEGKRIFHAGDLNNWHWNEESTPEEVRECEEAFLKEVAFLKQTTDRLDLAMFPVDSRLGKDYMRGPEQFVDRIKAGIFSPMHFGGAYEKAQAFRPYAEQAGCRFTGWEKTGESIEF